MKKIILFTLILIVTVATLYPIVTVVTVSLRPADRLLSTSLAIIPDDATIDNYIALFRDHPFARWMLNSTLVALAVTVFATRARVHRRLCVFALPLPRLSCRHVAPADHTDVPCKPCSCFRYF